MKAKASQRLIEMVLPAMAQLKRIIDKPDTSDSDRLRAIESVLRKAGFTERTAIDLNLLEPNEWDKLGASGFVIERGSIEDIDPGEIEGVPGPRQLPYSNEIDTDAWNLETLRQGNRDSLDRESYLADADEHDVIIGKVVPPPTGGEDSDGSPITFMGEEQRVSRARARRPSSMDPAPIPRDARRDLTDPPEYLRDRPTEPTRRGQRRR